MESNAETTLTDTTISLEVLSPLKTCLEIKDVSFAHINICGLINHLLEIKVLLHHILVGFLAITETHLYHDISDNEVSIDGYIIIRKDMPNGSPWAVAVLYITRKTWMLTPSINT
jgi:hypothetical protein